MSSKETAMAQCPRCGSAKLTEQPCPHCGRSVSTDQTAPEPPDIESGARELWALTKEDGADWLWERVTEIRKNAYRDIVRSVLMAIGREKTSDER